MGPARPLVARVERPAPLAFRALTGRRLRVNVVSETGMLGLVGQGGHTAFLDCAALARRHPDLDVRVNSREPCDVVHSHSWGPYYLWKGLGMSGRRVFTAHVVPATAEGTLPLAELARPLISWYLRALYDWSDVVVSVGPAATEAIGQLGVRAPVVTIPNALRTDRFFPSSTLRAEGRRLLGVDPDRPLVLGVGQVQPRKGIADFVAVAGAVPEATFVWVGGRPFGLATAGIAELNRLMRRAPPNVRFAGPFDLSDMPAVHNAADVMLFPSFEENCPYAPMEAAACGVPIVLRDLPAYRALYPDPYLHAGDVDGMADHVLALLGSTPHRVLWGGIARRLAARFSPEAWCERMAALYDAVATDQQQPAAPPSPEGCSGGTIPRPGTERRWVGRPPTPSTG